MLLAMALEEGATTSGMIKLDSSNYSLWKPMMEDILYCKDLYEPIVKEKIPTGVTEEEWRVLNRKTVRRFDCTSTTIYSTMLQTTQMCMRCGRSWSQCMRERQL